MLGQYSAKVVSDKVNIMLKCISGIINISSMVSTMQQCVSGIINISGIVSTMLQCVTGIVDIAIQLTQCGRVLVAW